jgi:phosphatidyl-myo-inositol alpha-mannosyltransferase
MSFRPLKIGFIAHVLPEKGKKVGGVSVVVQRLAIGLADLGHQVTVFSTNPPSEEVPFQWKPITSNAFLLKLCGMPVLDLFLIPIVLIFTNLRAYDILHFHGNDTFYCGKRPRVRTLHGSSIREFQYSPSLLRKLVMLLGFVFEWISIWRMDAIFTIGTDTAGIYGLGSDSIVPNPVGSGQFFPGEKTVHPQVFYNGYWKGRKRGHFAYQCFIEKVLPVFPDARLVFLGNECPAHPQVDFIKGATDEALAKFYRESWVFAYPSTYEGFGLAYVEAMASGTVVLTSPNSGANDILKDGTLGVLADDDSFGDRLCELLSRADLRAAYERSGLDRAMDFSQETVASDHLRRYEEVLARSQS